MSNLINMSTLGKDVTKILDTDLLKYLAYNYGFYMIDNSGNFTIAHAQPPEFINLVSRCLKAKVYTFDDFLKYIKPYIGKDSGGSLSPVEDNVNNPKHYNSHPSGIEAIEITRHMNFNLGNAVKYLWRNGLKDGQPAIQDLEKAIWYIKDEIKRLKNEL